MLGLKLAPGCLRSWFLALNGCLAHSRLEMSFLLQAEEFKYLGVVVVRKERRMRVTGAALGL